jgi:sulfite reductase (NADPH) hemoprotein beta-component/sulfite reductase (ferredoxin)
VAGYTLLAGGGMGMDANRPATHPASAQPLFFVNKEQAAEAAQAVLTVYRDHGDRADRKHSRLRYLIEDKGLDWFRKEVQSRLKFETQPPKPFEFACDVEPLGWNESAAGSFFTLRVWGGRICDEAAHRYRSAVREIAKEVGCPLRLTCNHNVVFHGLKPQQRASVDAILARHGLSDDAAPTMAHKLSMACVALPTCAFALTDGERAYPKLMSQFDGVLLELGLKDEPILFRISGCPNGCVRPYLADFGFVGRAPGRYDIYVGGSGNSGKLAQCVESSVPAENLAAVVRPLLQDFAAKRNKGETFGAYWRRMHA